MSPTYSTTHFYLAAYLCACGVEFLGVEKLPGGIQSQFIFRDSVEREQLTQRFLVDEATPVHVHAYIAQLKRLKSILREG